MATIIQEDQPIKLLAVVVAYNPDYEDLRRNICSYYSDVEKLIIWNNTPTESNDEVMKQLNLEEFDIEVRGDGENHLIAYPINRVIEFGLESGYTHLLTMDQDSCFDKGSVAKYREVISGYPADIYGVTYYRDEKDSNDSEEPIPVDYVIQSGSIYNLEMFKTVGLFREDYGIDQVDHEICLRARRFGYGNVVKLPNIYMHHIMGYARRNRFGVKISNYSAFRRYYLSKNIIMISKEYPEFYHISKRWVRKHVYKEIFKIALFERNRIKKISAIRRGIADGKSSFKKD